MTGHISSKIWGETDSGEVIHLFRLENETGSYVEITNYGAAIVSVVVPDRYGRYGHVVLGFPQVSAYLNDNCYLGSTIGRYANRISNAHFELNGESYYLETNDGVNANHGGLQGYNKRVFGAKIKENSLIMSLQSEDGDGGFPGNLELEVIYDWSHDNTLNIVYKAISDRDTPANFTNHTYFNLRGSDVTILEHKLTVSAAEIAEAGDDYIPTGRIINAADLTFQNNLVEDKVKNTGNRITGVNTYYVLTDELIFKNRFAAELTDERSGRSLKVVTSYPGLFVYTGDFLAGDQLNHYQGKCVPFGGLCLECQHYPDSINRPEFPQAITGPQRPYHEFITFKFGLI